MNTINYGISDGDGNQITVGLGEHNAREVAQRMADERGQSVWLWEVTNEDEGEEGEEFAPSGEGYSAEADDAEPSTVCEPEDLALDVYVTLTTPGGKTVSDNVTLWPHADGTPGYSTSGTPLDGWMGSNLCAAVRKMHDKAREAAIDAIRAAAVKACRSHKR